MQRADILKEIANILLINSQYMSQQGLFTGRAGVVYFFYYYARYSGNAMYGEYADHCLVPIVENLNRGMIKSFSNGIAGIGWAIDHFIRNRFVEADEDTLDEVDFSIEKMGITDFAKELSLDTPLFSKGIYFVQRRKPELISQTMEQLIEFMSNRDPIPLKLSYLNSILFFIHNSSRVSGDLARSKATDIILPRIEASVGAGLYNPYDIKMLKMYASAMDLDLNGLNHTPDVPCISGIAYFTDYVFDRMPDSELQVDSVELDHHIDSILQNINEDNLSLHYGLAGLGLHIMRQ